MKKEIFRGSAVAIVTPFDENGDVDFVALRNLIDWQIAQNTAAIVVCGTTGESATLSDSEFIAITDCAVKSVRKRVPVIVGTGSNDTHHSLVRSLSAQELGADALLIVTPYYNKTTQNGLISHFTYIADRVETPIILYNVPARTGMSFTAETYAALANHANIVAVKEASGNFNLMLQTRAKCPPDFAIYSGNDDQIIPTLAMGGSGVISVLANIAPRDTAEMCRLYFAGEGAGAIALQAKYSNLIDALFSETNPIPIKAALNMMGFDSGVLRLPLIEISAKCRLILQQEMEALGLIQ